MKKTILALSVALFPLTAHADVTISDKIVNEVVNDLKPAMCKNDLKQASKIVLDCYDKVGKDAKKNQDSTRCIIEDVIVLGSVKTKQNSASTEPYAGFLRSSNIKERTMKYPSAFFKKGEKLSQEKLMRDLAMASIKPLTKIQQAGCLDLKKLQ